MGRAAMMNELQPEVVTLPLYPKVAPSSPARKLLNARDIIAFKREPIAEQRGLLDTLSSFFDHLLAPNPL